MIFSPNRLQNTGVETTSQVGAENALILINVIYSTNDFNKTLHYEKLKCICSTASFKFTDWICDCAVILNFQHVVLNTVNNV